MKYLSRLFNSFRLKLALSFLLVILVVLTSIYFLAGHLAEKEFRDYVIRGNTNQAAGMRDVLVNYYRENGSWRGVDSVFTREGSSGVRTGRGSGNGRPDYAGGPRNIVLVDGDDEVIASYNDELLGRKVPPDLLEQGLKLDYRGRWIGTVLAGPLLSTDLSRTERQFLDSLRKSILYSGGAGLLIALVLGGILVRQLTRPLNRLTEATRKISRGELDQTVDIESGDELGNLGKSFNIMSKNLKESEEMRKRMIGDIAHELRTPLSIVLGEIEAIREGVYEPTEEKLSDIEDDLSLLKRLVEDLRELTLAESGELDLNELSVNLNDLVGKVAGQMRDVFEREDITIRLDPSDSPLEVMADPDRISQVLNNLLKNSVRSLGRGGRVEIRVKDEDQKATVEVMDNGQGIAEEKLDHVFERFYRGEASRSSSGTGLGLSIAKELVNAHGGEIWINSEEGKGTTVGFSLPK